MTHPARRDRRGSAKEKNRLSNFTGTGRWYTVAVRPRLWSIGEIG